MVFSKTVEENTTGIRANCSRIAPNLYLVTGTWTAGTDTKGTIETGLSHLIAHGTNVDTGTVTSEHKSQKNVDEDGSAEEGSIGILACAADNVGSWWGIGY